MSPVPNIPRRHGVHFPTTMVELLLFLLLLCLTTPTGVQAEKRVCDMETGECVDPDRSRIISAEELASKTGKTGDEPIWLSILGEVYDVTTGKEYYAADASYSYFAGRDASPCYYSGKFNDEELATADIMSYTKQQLGSLENWRQFYDEHEDYFFVGLLEGDYFDGDGVPTKLLRDVVEKLEDLAKKPTHYKMH